MKFQSFARPLSLLSLCLFTFFTLSEVQAIPQNPTEALFAKTINWKKATVDEGIAVYRAPDTDASSGLVPLRLVMTLPHNILKIASFMDRTDLKHQWIPKLEEAKIVQQNSLFDKVEYTHYSAPWPFHDRDFLISIKSQVDVPGKRIFVALVSEERLSYPLQKNRVRGYSKGAVTIKAIDANTTEIEMILVSDLKGQIPHWLMTMIQDKWPVGFVAGLKKKLETEEIAINPQFAKFAELAALPQSSPQPTVPKNSP